MNKQATEIFKFMLTGILNTGVDLAVFAILTHTHAPVLQSQWISYTCGMGNSYFLNKRWTFHSKKRAGFKEGIRFVSVNLLALGAVSLILEAVRQNENVPLFTAKMIATLCGMAINYVGSRFWVFRKTKLKGVNVNEN